MKVGDRIEATGFNGCGDPIIKGRLGEVLQFTPGSGLPGRGSDDVMIRWDSVEWRGEINPQSYSSAIYPVELRFAVISSATNDWDDCLELL